MSSSTLIDFLSLAGFAKTSEHKQPVVLIGIELALAVEAQNVSHAMQHEESLAVLTKRRCGIPRACQVRARVADGTADSSGVWKIRWQVAGSWCQRSMQISAGSYIVVVVPIITLGDAKY